MRPLDGIGVLVGPHTSFLDHLFPLSEIMGIPLLITDPWIKTMAEVYYPEKKIFDSDSPEEILSQFKTFFYVEPARLPHGGFRFDDFLFHGDQKSVYGLHGNSDKYRNNFWIERFADEEIVLLYGPYMVDFLKEKGVYSRIKKVILTGNYRYLYYKKYRSLFDKMAKPLLFPSTRRKTLFYAPTFCDHDPKNEDASSLFQVAPFLFNEVPDDFQILVKLHPYTFHAYPEKVRELKERYSSDQVFFLDEIPLIYPLLAASDLYLGDHSSIGYDFLAFDRPLFFFNQKRRISLSDRGVMLYRAGSEILPEDYGKIFSILTQGNEEKREARKDLYRTAFGSEEKSFSAIKEEVEEALL